MKEATYYTVIQKKDGHMYRIGKRKYDRDPERWEIVDYFTYMAKQHEPDNNSIIDKIQEFTNTDIDLGDYEPPSLSNLAYNELRKTAVDLGLEVTGNPKKEVLLNMISEAKE